MILPIHIALCSCGAWDVSKEPAFQVHKNSGRERGDNCRVTVLHYTIDAGTKSARARRRSKG
jgi:hypothetical protein